MGKTLTGEALQAAADALGVELAAIRAVDEVESRGVGFTPDGRVKVLFERHKFHQFTQGRFDHSHPNLSNPTAGGYGKGSQYSRFSEAFELDKEAAMMATSWGRYQIMGFNHLDAGFTTVGAFVDAMKVSEDEQLKAFVKIIKAWGLASELREHQWAIFARQYNGAAYRKNKYDQKLADAYEKFRNEPLVTEAVTEEQKVDEPSKGTTTGTKSADETSGTPPPAPAVEVKASEVPLWTRITSLSIPTGVTTAIGGVVVFAKALPPYAWIAFSVIVVAGMVIGYLVWKDGKDEAHERTKIVMQAAADRDRNNLRLI